MIFLDDFGFVVSVSRLRSSLRRCACVQIPPTQAWSSLHPRSSWCMHSVGAVSKLSVPYGYLGPCGCRIHCLLGAADSVCDTQTGRSEWVTKVVIYIKIVGGARLACFFTQSDEIPPYSCSLGGQQPTCGDTHYVTVTVYCNECGRHNDIMKNNKK